jgi:predicted nucleic acid-binding protein
LAVYVDTSAFLRGLLPDAFEHAQLNTLLADPAVAFVSSDLLRLEARRAAVRLVAIGEATEALPPQVDSLLARVTLVQIDRSVVDRAAAIPEVVKSLDAIHVATAELLGDSVDFAVTYDQQTAAVMTAHGIEAITAAQALHS